MSAFFHEVGRRRSKKEEFKMSATGAANKSAFSFNTPKGTIRSGCFVRIKGPLKYLLMPLLGKNQLAITLHMYASIGPNLDNTHRGQI